MTDDRSGPSAARTAEARITAAATDWRAAAQMLGPRDATWSLPLIDVLLGAACLLIAWSDLSFIDRFGIHAVYVADIALAVVIAAAQPLRRRMVRVSFTVTAGSFSHSTGSKNFGSFFSLVTSCSASRAERLCPAM